LVYRCADPCCPWTFFKCGHVLWKGTVGVAICCLHYSSEHLSQTRASTQTRASNSRATTFFKCRHVLWKGLFAVSNILVSICPKLAQAIQERRNTNLADVGPSLVVLLSQRARVVVVSQAWTRHHHTCAAHGRTPSPQEAVKMDQKRCRRPKSFQAVLSMSG
jgi:hypothetical protein